jgi:hypothetical protein
MQDQGFKGNIGEEMMGLKNLTFNQKAIVDSHADRESDQSWEELRTHPDLLEKFDDDSKPDSEFDDTTDTESIASAAAVFLAHPFPVAARSIGCTLPHPCMVKSDFNSALNEAPRSDCGSPCTGSATAAFEGGNSCTGLAAAYGDEPKLRDTSSKCVPGAASYRGDPCTGLTTAYGDEPKHRDTSSKSVPRVSGNSCTSSTTANGDEPTHRDGPCTGVPTTDHNPCVPTQSKYGGIAKSITLMAACYAVSAPIPEGVPIFDTPGLVYEPTSHTDAVSCPDAKQWLAAEDEEVQAFFDSGTWSIAPIEPDYNLISAKWVYKHKLHPEPRYRARLVAKGFQQRDGIDYGDVFSPVVRYSTVRIVFALCAHYCLFTRHLDCPKAFTQADLDTPIYLRAPPGVKIPFGCCFKVLKSIYGLKQASRLFHELLTEYLLDNGFTRCASDPCLFFIFTDDDLAIICLYVDDLLLCTSTFLYGHYWSTKFHGKFNTNDLGEIKFMLGMRVTISPCRSVVALDLEEYIMKIVDRFGFTALSSIPTPMLHTVKLSARDCPTTHEGKTAMSQYPFRQAIACLMFAMIVMRPDISFAVISCARFSANPGLPHWEAVRRIYQYLIGCPGLKLTYSRIEDASAPLMYGRSDADWATSDVDERRTVIGHLIMLSGAAIFWSTRFWKPCLSIHEGEFGAATELARETVGAQQLLCELPLTYAQVRGKDPVTIVTDSMGTMLVANNPKAHSASKHCHIREAWMQGMVREGLIRVQHDLREANSSDNLVKANPKAIFRLNRDRTMGPYQDLVIKMTAGEKMRKRKLEDRESTTG